MSVKLLTEHNLKLLRFTGGCTGSSESTFVKILHCWKSHVMAPGRVAQSVTCLATDACLTADPGVADPGVASSIPARSHTFVEIDHEIISSVILLPSADLFKKGCCQLQAKVCAQLLVNRLFKPAQEKVWLSELTVPQ